MTPHRKLQLISLRTGKLTGNSSKLRGIPASLSGFESCSPSPFNGLRSIPCSFRKQGILFIGTGNFSPEQGIVGRGLTPRQRDRFPPVTIHVIIFILS